MHGESKDYTYINAVEVDGFTRKSEFIVTEWPKAQTIDSFWTLIFDHSCHTVVNLTNVPNNKVLLLEREICLLTVLDVSSFYPHKRLVVERLDEQSSRIVKHVLSGKKNYGPFTVEVLNYQNYPGISGI